MTPDRQIPDNDVSLFLRNHYQSSVPVDFQNVLLRKLETELPHRQWNVRHMLGAAAIAAAIAAAVSIAVWVAIPQRGPRLNSPTLSGATTAPALPGSVAYAMTTFADDVAQSPLIVLVRINNVHELTADCSIIETLYGTTPETSMHVDLGYGDPEIRKGYEVDARRRFFRDHSHEPSPEELLTQMQYMHSLKEGRQGILMLAPPAKRDANVQGKVMAYHAVRIDFQDPVPLLAWEKQIANVLRDGSYLKPFTLGASVMEAKIAAADAIVHATLTKIGDADATWHVDKTLKGKMPVDFAITHELFDRRAAALVAIAAINDPALNDPNARASRIQGEKQTLLKNELIPGKEAILFIGNVQTQGAQTAAALQAREFGNGKDKNLSFTEASIVKMLETTIVTRPAEEPLASSMASRGRASSIVGASKDQQMLEAELIVRARITGWKGREIEYAITRVIFGNLDDKALRVNFLEGSTMDSLLDISREQFKKDHAGRDPIEEELYARFMEDHSIIKGHEVILLLQPIMDRPLSSKTKALPVMPARYQTVEIFRDNRPLDELEAEYVQIVKEGTFLEPLPSTSGRSIADVAVEDRTLWLQWYKADAVVRATAMEVTDTATRWRVDKALKGKIETPELVIGHETFQRRAEAIVRYAAIKDPALNDPAKKAERVRQEMKVLIQAEVMPQCQGILFLNELKPNGACTYANMQARVYDTSKRTTLNDVETAIVPQETMPSVPAPGHSAR